MATNKQIPGYQEAISEIEAILRIIESDEMDIDLLSEKVKRAVSLINLCKEKITNTKEEVAQILKDFDE